MEMMHMLCHMSSRYRQARSPEISSLERNISVNICAVFQGLLTWLDFSLGPDQVPLEAVVNSCL